MARCGMSHCLRHKWWSERWLCKKMRWFVGRLIVRLQSAKAGSSSLDVSRFELLRSFDESKEWLVHLYRSLVITLVKPAQKPIKSHSIASPKGAICTLPAIVQISLSYFVALWAELLSCHRNSGASTHHSFNPSSLSCFLHLTPMSHPRLRRALLRGNIGTMSCYSSELDDRPDNSFSPCL